jgi:hypothetical protein
MMISCGGRVAATAGFSRVAGRVRGGVQNGDLAICDTDLSPFAASVNYVANA